MDIYTLLANLGYKTASADQYSAIDSWRSWYEGDVTGFHRFKVYNGTSHIRCRRYGLGMAKKVCEDWANLLFNEKVHITLEGEREQDLFDAVCKANSFRVKANEAQELKSALGTVAYVFRPVNAKANGETGVVTGADGIAIDYVTADRIFPLSWQNGIVSECAFASVKYAGKKSYLYLQIHKLTRDGTYDIENRLYGLSNGNIRAEVPLSTLPELENVPAVTHTGMAQRQFVLDRMNIVNNLDSDCPMGIAVFANAIDALKGADIAYDSYVNEFVLGKKRIMAKLEALKSIDGEAAFDQNDVVFYALPEDSSGDTLIKEIDMTLRTAEHNTGIQDMLNIISSKCGFGEKHYKFDSGSVATATQVVSENSNLFRSIKKHEIILHDVLEEIARIILRMGNTYLHAGVAEDVEISIDFDDSIIEDKAAEFDRDCRLLQMGILSDVEFRMKWMNEDEETARAALPGAAALEDDVITE